VLQIAIRQATKRKASQHNLKRHYAGRILTHGAMSSFLIELCNSTKIATRFRKFSSTNERRLSCTVALTIYEFQEIVVSHVVFGGICWKLSRIVFKRMPTSAHHPSAGGRAKMATSLAW
jgi:hypothetical protein